MNIPINYQYERWTVAEDYTPSPLRSYLMRNRPRFEGVSRVLDTRSHWLSRSGINRQFLLG